MRAVLNLGEIVAAHARLSPHKIGARDSRRALTFAQWNERACRLANALLGLGLRKGDRVALLAYNRVEWMEMYVALAKAGLVAVPVNFRLVGPEIEYIAGHCDARALIVQDDLAERVEGLRGSLPIGDNAWIHLGDSTPAGWTGYEALIAAASDADPQPRSGRWTPGR
jgi:acyl-CoA synthetase (AMP-forming)/AMP-acid ligase II